MDDLIRDGALWSQIRSSERRILNQRSEFDRVKDSNRDLEVRFERLKLITMAMWDLVSAANGLTESDLRRAIRSLDLADERLDGRAKPKMSLIDCNQCHRVLLSSAVVCAFCGAENENYDPVANL